MRKIIFSLVVFLALLLALEVGVTLLIQHGMERAMRSQYDLPSSLKVSINSFPLIVSLFRNHLGELRLSWEGDMESLAPGGEKTNPSYYGQVNLYDVELNMPSLLTGKLDIREISRIKAAITLDENSLNEALGRESGEIRIEDGEIFEVKDGQKIQYKVKVADDNTIAMEPYFGSISGVETSENTQGDVKAAPLEVELTGLPMNAALKRATSEGNKVVLEVSIPMWEGYI